MKKIRITIDKAGAVRTEALGFTGDECREATEPFRRALGGKQAEALTNEFHAQKQENVLTE